MPEWKAEIRQRLTRLHLSPTRENSIVEELAQDLDDCYAALLASGANEAKAWQQTLAELHDGEILRCELQRVEWQTAAMASNTVNGVATTDTETAGMFGRHFPSDTGGYFSYSNQT